MKSIYLKSLFLISVAILFLSPLFQMKYNIFPKLQLYGVEQAVQYPTFSFASFIKGEYQKNFQDWFNQNYGMKEYFVKLSNQIYYSLFNDTSPTSQVAVGEKGQLFEGGYITEYLNIIPPLSLDILESGVKDMKELQDRLKERGKAFVLLITPSKAAIYPEYISDRRKNLRKGGLRNYDLLIPLLDKYGINYVDGHKITLDQKSKNDMFPRGGTHWNNLAAYYSASEFLKKAESLTGRNMVDIELSDVEMKSPVGTDKDLANLMNVWFKPINYKSPYPVYKTEIKGNEFKPSIFMDAASFSEQFVNALKSNNVFSSIDVFFYNTHIVFKEGVYDGQILGNIEKVDWENDVFSKDIVIFEMNEQSIGKIQNGFIQSALLSIKPLIFTHINETYVENVLIDGKPAYKIKKGADGKGTLYLQTDKIELEPNKEYMLSYKAKGFFALNCDLFPDDLPQYNNNSITDEANEYSVIFKSDSVNMKNAYVRFFIDGLSDKTDKESYLYDIKLTCLGK